MPFLHETWDKLIMQNNKPEKMISHIRTRTRPELYLTISVPAQPYIKIEKNKPFYF
jgi:hypothetical protein